MATVKKTAPVDSKGNPKKYEPMFGGPLARGIANLSNRISENSSKIMEQSRQIELGKERAAKLAELKKKYPAPAYKGTFAPLKPMSFISQPSAPKAAPAARPAAKTTPRPAASASAPAAKPMARPSAPVAKVDTLMPRSVSTEMQPMAKREVKVDTTTKRGNLLQRLGERVKQRQLARASKSVGTPMKSTTSIPSTPTPSAPQTESGQKLSAVGKAMLDKYMSKKYMGGGKMEYMGGGKMKKYAKGGMIEKEGAKPKKKTAMDGLKALGKYVSTFGLATEGYNPAEGRYPKKKVEAKNQESLKKYKYGGKMDKKKAFMEMIAKLKAKKK